MPFEVIVSGSKKVADQAAVDTLVGKVQGIFGTDTSIIVNEVKKTFDAQSALGKEVGSVTNRVAEYPSKAKEEKIGT